jgi:peptidoglycan/LPS O-acetylase OafA/YrhL
VPTAWLRRAFDPAAYRRITSDGRFVPEVDGIRFVAILAVLLLHLNTTFKRVFPELVDPTYPGSPIDLAFGRGDTGVEIFFALSGFVLALPFCRANAGLSPKVSLSRYYLRRLTRLEPPFIVSTVGIFVLGCATGILVLPDAWPHLLATLTYTHSFVYGEWSTINPVTWSLETEVQFYLLAPALAVLFSARSPRLRMATLLAGWFLATVLPDKATLAPYHLQFSLIAYLHTFLVGFLFCELYVHWSWVLQGRHAAFDVVGIGALVGLMAITSVERMAFDLLLLAFFVAVFNGRLLHRFLTASWVTAIGGACYSLYLLHFATLFVAMRALDWLVLPSFPATFVVHAVIGSGTVLIVCMTFFRYIERPFMQRTWPQDVAVRIRERLGRGPAAA